MQAIDNIKKWHNRRSRHPYENIVVFQTLGEKLALEFLQGWHSMFYFSSCAIECSATMLSIALPAIRARFASST